MGKSYDALFTKYGMADGLNYGSQNILDKPLYFIYSGYTVANSLTLVGSEGGYWYASPNSSGSAHYLKITTSQASSTSINRYYGFSVRCIAR